MIQVLMNFGGKRETDGLPACPPSGLKKREPAPFKAAGSRCLFLKVRLRGRGAGAYFACSAGAGAGATGDAAGAGIDCAGGAAGAT